MDNSLKIKTFKGLIWKLLERFGVSGVQFVLQIILARLLDPEHYGALSIIVIFTSLANVFIQNGFSTSLIQNKDVTEEDYSSVFWLTLGVSILLYIIMFISAPYIAGLYHMPDIIQPFRVLALVLLPGALNSVQLAKVSREMDFQKVFLSNVGAIAISGIVGIILAYMGAGIWALVAQNFLSVFIACIVMFFTVSLRLRFVINWKRIKVLFSFGWKLLVSSLLNTLYQDLRSLVIGLKYNSDTLGFYNRGKQFPQFIVNAVNGAVQGVLLPAMSEKQEDRVQIKNMMSLSISLSAYVIFPIMTGLAAVATPLVSLLLTDKWLPCVPYMQIYCFTLAFYPVHSCNLQAINAMGRSDVFLKLEIQKKISGIILLVLAVFMFDSPIAIAMSGLIGNITGWLINARPNLKLVSYSYKEQLLDFWPSFVMSMIMYFVVNFVGSICSFNPFIVLCIQVPLGVVCYLLLSFIFKPKAFTFIFDQLKNYKNKRGVL